MIGLKLIFCSVTLGFFKPNLQFPESFYLFNIVGVLAGTPILCTFTGVEFNWELGFITLVLTGVDAFVMAAIGLTRWLALI
jgi:hypothetical protein